VWKETDLYYNTLSATLCERCGTPETALDRKKLEIRKVLKEEFGDTPDVFFGKIIDRIAELLKPYFAALRQSSSAS